MDFELIEDRQGPEARTVGENLTAHRVRALGFEAISQPICLVHRAPDGRVLAGLVAEVLLDWLYIEKFWVDESLRGQGIGATYRPGDAASLAAAVAEVCVRYTDALAAVAATQELYLWERDAAALVEAYDSLPLAPAGAPVPDLSAPAGSPPG